jgi:hypothetical protein
MAARLARLGAATLLSLASASKTVCAQTDEIQVYNAEINTPGQFSITLHNNYTPIGPTTPAFPGGTVPNHSWNGVPEYAYGITDWLELGAYLPLYTLTGAGRFQIDGAKLRALFAVPHAAERRFFYGINFEFSDNAPYWATSRYSGEMRPIIGGRAGAVDLILNPIVDYGLPITGIGSFDFAPCARLAYNFSEKWATAVEHYAEYGAFGHFVTVAQQQQTLYGVVDYSGEPLDVEFGIGHGFTPASEALILKLILTHAF